MIHEKDLTPESLLKAIIKIIDDENKRKYMAKKSHELGWPKAADDLADIVISLSRGHA